jgi:hypothetical protein
MTQSIKHTALEDVVKRVQEFEAASLTDRLSDLEMRFRGLKKKPCGKLCISSKLDFKLLYAASELKKIASQINVVIHAVGILTSLPAILQDGEQIEYLSLGAGNTGRKFDLETNLRIAEFKFISWKGGSESIRQNSTFKDFFGLAEEKSSKKKYLYVLGTEKPLKFLTGQRALDSVMSRNAKLAKEFAKRYNSRFSCVREYYRYRKSSVQIVDLTAIIPELRALS